MSVGEFSQYIMFINEDRKNIPQAGSTNEPEMKMAGNSLPVFM
jgi:hypothetical protein